MYKKQAAPSRLFFVVQSCLADAYFVVLSNQCLIGTRLTAIFFCQVQRCPITRFQKLLFPIFAIPPTRSNCMDYIFAGQVVSLCDFCAACLAAMQRTALCKQLWSGSTMNAAVHTTTAPKRRVGSIDDCVNAHFCNIVSDNLQWHEAYPHSSDQCPCLFKYLFKVSHTLLSILPESSPLFCQPLPVA